MRLAHPWKDILFGQLKEMEEAQPIESTDIQETQSEIQVRFSLLIETATTTVANSNQEDNFLIPLPCLMWGP